MRALSNAVALPKCSRALQVSHRTKARLVPWQLEAHREKGTSHASALTSPAAATADLAPHHTPGGCAGPGRLASVLCLDPELSLQSHREGYAHIAGPQRAGPCDPVLTSWRGCRGGPVSPGEASTPGRTCSASAPGTGLPPSAHGPHGPFPRGGAMAGGQCLPLSGMPAPLWHPAPPGQLDKWVGGCDAPSLEQWQGERWAGPISLIFGC